MSGKARHPCIVDSAPTPVFSGKYSGVADAFAHAKFTVQPELQKTALRWILILRPYPGFEAAQEPEPLPVVARVTDPSNTDSRDRRRALLDYLENGRSPCDLPTWFWDTPTPPAFVPPINTFHYEFGAKGLNDQRDAFVTAITRTAGYSMTGSNSSMRAPVEG